MSSREIIRTDNVSVRIMELDEGAATEWHFHTAVADFFVCLTGVVTVETRDPAETSTLSPGERAEVHVGQVHRVVNLSPGKAEYLLVQGVGAYDFRRV
ncbi:MAG TPA: cupin domain-containing protein [Geobacteraceae bacterium]|nr:cupin domain-containing protein [Geobacteraceae bacterium]